MEDEKPEDVGLSLRVITLNSNKQEPSQCYACLPHDWGSANPHSTTMGPGVGVRLLSLVSLLTRYIFLSAVKNHDLLNQGKQSL